MSQPLANHIRARPAPRPTARPRFAVHAAAQTWLNTLCSDLDGLVCAAVLVRKETVQPCALWPTPNHDVDSLLAVGEETLSEKRTVVKRTLVSAGGEPGALLLGTPVPIDDHEQLAVVMQCPARLQAECKQLLKQLQHGIPWLQFSMRQGSSAQATRQNTLLAQCLDCQSAHEATVSFTTELATQFACERVLLGLLRRQRVEIAAMSHSASHKHESEMLRRVSDAMEEAIDQDATIALPLAASGRNQVSIVHEQLLVNGSGNAVCTVPICYQGQIHGAVCLEWTDSDAISAQVVQDIEQLVASVAPLLVLRRREEQAWWRRLTRRGPTGAAGKSRTRGYSVAAGLGLMLLLALAPIDYRIHADAVLEGRVQRVVVAPFDGYIAKANVRAGAIVEKGQLLAAFEDKDLRLERTRSLTEKQKYLREHRDAMARRSRAEARIVATRIEQADAKLALLESQLDRIQLRAPFDGVVITGDLSQSLGAPIGRGEELFTLAPLDRYRVMLKVDERDIGDISAGQTGRVVLASRPGEPLSFVVDTITAVSTAEAGANYFRVEGLIENGQAGLLPGMEGVGKIEVDQRSLLRVMTHRVVQWFKLQAWYWLP